MATATKPKPPTTVIKPPAPRPAPAAPVFEAVSAAEILMQQEAPTSAGDQAAGLATISSEGVSFEPIGPVKIQDEAYMQQATVSTPIGGFDVKATNHPLTRWYHEKDGTTSDMPTSLDNYYGKKPGWVKSATKAWKSNAGTLIRCPVKQCLDSKGERSMIRVQSTLDNEDLQALGIKGFDSNEDIQVAWRMHCKAFHKRTFSQMVRRGEISPIEAANL